ncbi:MAG: hypothetical protein MJ056_07265 [Akkermansia sp.]|nr:hypothetical protein [Akkermansia sp.]
MKAFTLILTVVCALSFSSCCCQSQPMPKLRPLPGNCDVPQQQYVPVKVWTTKGKCK